MEPRIRMRVRTLVTENLHLFQLLTVTNSRAWDISALRRLKGPTRGWCGYYLLMRGMRFGRWRCRIWRVVAGMPFFTLHRIHLLLTNRVLLYCIHSQFYRVYIHSTLSIVSVVKHYLSLPSRTHQDPKQAWSYALPPPWSTPREHRAPFSSGLRRYIGNGCAEERGKRGGQTRVGGGGQCVFRAGGYLMCLSPVYLVASVHCDGWFFRLLTVINVIYFILFLLGYLYRSIEFLFTIAEDARVSLFSLPAPNTPTSPASNLNTPSSITHGR